MKRTTKWLVGLIVGLTLAVSALTILRALHRAHIARLSQEWRLFEERETEEAKSVIAQFHEDFNSGRFDIACDDEPLCKGSERLRRDWHSTVQGVWNRFGKFKGVTKSEITVFSEPFSIHANYYSSFEKDHVKETFILEGRPDGGLRIETFQTAWSPTSVQ